MLILVLAALVTAVGADVLRGHVARLLRAIELAGLTELQACQEMGIRQNQWHAQKSGEGHISFSRLALLPRAVHQWYAVLLAQDLGLPREVRGAWKLAIGRKRMARAALAVPAGKVQVS